MTQGSNTKQRKKSETCLFIRAVFEEDNLCAIDNGTEGAVARVVDDGGSHDSTVVERGLPLRASSGNGAQELRKKKGIYE